MIAFMSRAAAPSAAAAGPITVALRKVVGRILRLRAQGGRISEQDSNRILITRAIEALGWSILETDEVRNECRHNAADNPADYTLFLNWSLVPFVKVRLFGYALDDRRRIVQAINYADPAGVDWCGLTNGAQWRSGGNRDPTLSGRLESGGSKEAGSKVLPP